MAVGQDLHGEHSSLVHGGHGAPQRPPLRKRRTTSTTPAGALSSTRWNTESGRPVMPMWRTCAPTSVRAAGQAAQGEPAAANAARLARFLELLQRYS